MSRLNATGCHRQCGTDAARAYGGTAMPTSRTADVMIRASNQYGTHLDSSHSVVGISCRCWPDIGDRPLAWSHFTRRARRWRRLPESAETAGPMPTRHGENPPGAGRIWSRAGGHRPDPRAHTPGRSRRGTDTAPKSWRLITAELQARGWRCAVAASGHSRGDLASSPRHPDRGLRELGYDGFMVWGRWTPAADSDRAAGIVG